MPDRDPQTGRFIQSSSAMQDIFNAMISGGGLGQTLENLDAATTTTVPWNPLWYRAFDDELAQQHISVKHYRRSNKAASYTMWFEFANRTYAFDLVDEAWALDPVYVAREVAERLYNVEP